MADLADGLLEAHLDFLWPQLQLHLGPGRLQLRQQLIRVRIVLLLLLLQQAGGLCVQQRLLRTQERQVSWSLDPYSAH